MSDVEELVAFAGASAEAPSAQDSDQEVLELVAMAAPGAAPNAGGAPHDPEADEVRDLVAASEAKRKYSYHSWEHAGIARAGKKVKAAQRKAQQLRQDKKALGHALACAAAVHPSIRTIVAQAGCVAPDSPEVQLIAISHLAFSPSAAKDHGQGQ